MKLLPSQLLAPSRCLLFIACLAVASAPLRAEEVQPIILKTLTAQMKFDQSELFVSPGARVKLVFENPDDMPHNVVFCNPGTDVEKLVMKMLEKPELAIQRGFIPEDPSVWLHSRLLNPHEKQELEFTAPKNPGIYPYVCSFPGHALSMKGNLKVLGEEGPKLTQLQFALYLGDWVKLPDFQSLTPHRSGSVEDNLIQLKFDDYKNQYALVFTGKLRAPRTADYTFSLASDDGGRLLIDNEPLLTHDGIHAAAVREKKKRLTEGEHDVRVEYFQAAGQAELFLAWRSDFFDITALSKWKPADWRVPVALKTDEFSGLPLQPQTEPIIYRNFIAGAGNRPIAVGFPGGLNFAWSAESMNLALVWRGAFVDAARHWRNRGGGHQPPAGFDVERPVELAFPLATLPSPDQPWPSFNANNPSADYRWKGYSLDPKGIPTFEYHWKSLQIRDRLEAQGDFKSPAGRLVRSIHIQGTPPPNTFLLLARGSSIRSAGTNAFQLAGPSDFTIEAKGARIQGDQLIVPVQKNLEIHYRWPKAHTQAVPKTAP
jgi:plastocyanin